MAAPWPDKAARKVLNSVVLELESCLKIDPDCSDIVENLFSSNCINNNQKDDIYSGRTNLARVGKLLDCLYRRGSTDSFVAFVDILGSDEGEKLPEMRKELIRKYGVAGGDLTVFGVEEANDIPSLSRAETSREIPITPLPADTVVQKTCPAAIRDVMISLFTENPIIVMLLDFNRCARLIWHSGNHVTEPQLKPCPRAYGKETADSLLLLRPQRMALLWSKHIHYVDISFEHTDEAMKFEKQPFEVHKHITCQAAVKDDTFVIGDQDGHVTLLSSNNSGRPSLVLKMGIPVDGVVVNGDKLLAWSEDGYRTMATVRDGRFENHQNSRTRSLQDGCRLRACAGDFSKHYAECIQVASGQIVLNTFKDGQQKLKTHNIGNMGPNMCLQLLMDDDECVAVTVERFVYVRKHAEVRQFSLPWKDEDVEHLRVQKLGSGHFLLVAAWSTNCSLLPIKLDRSVFT